MMPSDEWRAELKREMDKHKTLGNAGSILLSAAVDVALAFAEEKVREERKKNHDVMTAYWVAVTDAQTRARIALNAEQPPGVLQPSLEANPDHIGLWNTERGKPIQPPGESRCGTCGGRVDDCFDDNNHCPDAFHRPPQQENSLIDDEQTNAQMERAIASAIHEQDDPPEVLNVRRPPTEGGGE